VGVERGATHTLEIFQGEAELGQNLVVRNAFAMIEGRTSSSDLAGLFLRDRLIVQWGVGKTAGDGIA
jgi:hypothetical protein